MKNFALSGVIFTAISLTSAPASAASNLWLFSLSYENNKPSIEQARKITDTDSYTNQPHFFSRGQKLYYTQQFDAGSASQTDVMEYNLVNQYHRNLTYTATSEYSPTPMPEADGFSTILVDKKQKQWLWLFDGGRGHKFSDVEPIGYHAWINNDEALVFVLGEPHTLQRLGRDRKPEVLDKNIGPSLWKIPDTTLFSYTKNPEPENQPWTLMSYDPEARQSSLLVTLPESAYYMAWTPGAKALTIVDNVILAWDFREPVVSEMPNRQAGHTAESADTTAPAWQPWLDISDYCPQGGSRLHVSHKGTHLAVVCEEGSEG